MKKQIITVLSVALAALVLFGAYKIFFEDDGITESTDAFYTLTPAVKDKLAAIEEKAEITLCGYNPDDDGWVRISLFAASVEGANSKFSVNPEGEISDFTGVAITSGGKTEYLAYDSFFKSLYDGTKYAFDGESLMANAIFSLTGTEKSEISLRALPGYDTDGDIVTATGYPFLFTSLQRSEISFLTINNENGRYSIYQKDGSFYFSGSTIVGYDDEAFSKLTTNCRYPVSLGKIKMPADKTWASYGLDNAENATCSYSLMSVAADDGSYFLHTVYVGAKASTGTHYYARYIGGLFSDEKDADGNDKMIQNLSKDGIYLLSSADVESSLCAPATDIMSSQLSYGISSANDTSNIKDVYIDYYEEGISALVRNMMAFNPASNLALLDASAISKVLSDKVSAGDYTSYEGGWKNNISVFGGFTSSDGKGTYIEAALAKFAADGTYKVTFGLVRDDTGGAALPMEVRIQVSPDGVNYVAPKNAVIAPSQADKTVEKYSFEFQSEEKIKFVRIRFDVPQTANTYVVMDEIRIYADGEDAQPTDSTRGIWRLVSPPEYIATGRNFAYLDSDNFSSFLYSAATLVGDKVVEYAICENGNPDKMDAEKLAKFGLDNPARHISYVFDGVTTDLYISKKNESGNRYIYSVMSGDSGGTQVRFCTDIICEVTPATAAWLDWDFVELLDHSLLSMYINEIDSMKLDFDGKTYEFLPKLDSEGDIGSVTYGGKEYDVLSFKYLYESVLKIYMHDEYIPQEGDEPVEYLRIKIKTDTRSPEFVFYRVSASRCYFTLDGEGSYYALVEDVNLVRENVLRYIAGEEIRR